MSLLGLMMNGDNCRICLQALEDGGFYHASCCKKLFDAPQSPSLPYSWSQINELTDRLTEQKYRASMEQVGKAILRHCTNPVFDALRLFELTVFCFLTGNADMHLKNFSLRYRPGGEVELSPAYDLLRRFRRELGTNKDRASLSFKRNQVSVGLRVRLRTRLSVGNAQCAHFVAHFSLHFVPALVEYP